MGSAGVAHASVVILYLCLVGIGGVLRDIVADDGVQVGGIAGGWCCGWMVFVVDGVAGG